MARLKPCPDTNRSRPIILRIQRSALPSRHFLFVNGRTAEGASTPAHQNRARLGPQGCATRASVATTPRSIPLADQRRVGAAGEIAFLVSRLKHAPVLHHHAESSGEAHAKQ